MVDPYTILWFGNSHTERNDLPGMVAGLAQATAPPRALRQEAHTRGGASLRYHLNRAVTQQRLEARPWHAVVLQEQSARPFRNPDRMRDNVRDFAARVAPTGARLVLYMTWPWRDQPEARDTIVATTQDCAAAVGATLAPVGAVWARALDRHPDLPLYADDGRHASPLGTYLAACVLHAVLLDAPPGVVAWAPEHVASDAAATVRQCVAEDAAL